jgi:hypothetical protein
MKKKIFICSCITVLSFTITTNLKAQVVIGPVDNNSTGQLIINNSSKGLLMPRLTAARRQLISTPANGLQVFTTDNNAIYHYSPVAGWVRNYDSLNNPWHKSGGSLFTPVQKKVGINIASPLSTMNVFSPLINGVSFTDGVTGTGANDGVVLQQASDGTVNFTNLENISYHFGTNGTEKLTISTQGNIGINNTNPTDPLSFQTVTGQKINFLNVGTGNTNYGIGIQGARIEIHSGSSGYPVQFGYGRTNSLVVNKMEVVGGGDVGNGSMNVTGKLLKAASNGPADLLPVAYGKVNRDGVLLSGTSNVSSSYQGSYNYRIVIDGENFSNPDSYCITITPYDDSRSFGSIGKMYSTRVIPFNSFTSGFDIEIRSYGVRFQNRSCGAGGEVCLAQIGFSPGTPFDEHEGFAFIVYKF